MGGFGDGSTDNTDPKVFATIVIFDKNYKFLDVDYQQLTSSGSMNASYVVKEAGYAFMYVSNEHPTLTDVYFDDITMAYTPTNILQSNEYYPFGLQTANSWTRDNSSNNFLYNQGSELNATTGMYDLPYRNYDAALGRFFQVDLLAHKSHDLTPYHYAGNNPIAFNDPSGLLEENNIEGDGSNETGNGFGGWSEDGGGGGGEESGGNPESGSSSGITVLSSQTNEDGSITLSVQGTDGFTYNVTITGSDGAYNVDTGAQNYTALQNSDGSFNISQGTLLPSVGVVDNQTGGCPTCPGSSGDGRGSAESFSFGFAFGFGISGEWGTVHDETGASKNYYTVSANFGLGLDIGFNKKEIIPTDGKSFRVDQYQGFGKNLSVGAFFASESRGGNYPTQTLDPFDMGTNYKERSNSYSPFLGLPVGFGLGDVGVLYQLGKTEFYK